MSIATMHSTNQPAPSLLSLAWLFLRIGSTSFGGYLALVSVVRTELVEKRQWLDDQELVENLSLSSFLPGPVSVNVVAAVGYALNGWIGALVCMTAVLLPSFLLMILFAELYAQFSDLTAVGYFLAGVLPVIAALIASVAYQMARRNLSGWPPYVLAVIVGVILLAYGSFWTIVGLMIVAGIWGFRFAPASAFKAAQFTQNQISFSSLWILPFLLLFFLFPFQQIADLISLPLTFGKVSLTLFGGGYVMIPVLQELLVNELQWIERQAFLDAIAFGQVTPGPILVSATFIGYQLQGWGGAALATIGIFYPSALLMVSVSAVFRQWRQHPVVLRVFYGIRPAIVGMIAASSVSILQNAQSSVFGGILFLMAFVALVRYSVSIFYLLIAGGGLGWLYFSYV